MRILPSAIFIGFLQRHLTPNFATACGAMQGTLWFIGHELDTLSAISFSLRKRNDARCRTSASNSRRRTARSRASTYRRPDDASRSRAAPGGAKAQFQKGWDAWKACGEVGGNYEQRGTTGLTEQARRLPPQFQRRTRIYKADNCGSTQPVLPCSGTILAHLCRCTVITDDIATIVPSFSVPTIGPFGSPWTFNVSVCATLQGSAHAIPPVASRPASTLMKPRILLFPSGLP